MTHCNWILSQILKLIPRHEFESLVVTHHTGRSFRAASRWSQFVSMAIGQLTGRKSLRNIVDNLGDKEHRLYHLGVENNRVLTLQESMRINLINCTKGFWGSC